ncbi:fructosamine kinase PKL/CAK/FruK [Ramaria rubella]|nr:fructosamine kinase PKL/CAK/FruK [Ramaria rubella]
MPLSSSIPPAISAALHRVEPDAQFIRTGSSQAQSSTSNRSYFVKQGSSGGSDMEQYRGEAESLRSMHAACPGICPIVFESSVDPATKQPVFISEFKKIGSLNKHSAAALGRSLAEMHNKGKSPDGRFGFDVPTYCGATRMRNGWSKTWAEAYDKMIGDLLETLRYTGQFDDTCRLGEEVRKRVIPHLLGSLNIKPSLLHGDLWSGNAGTDYNTGNPVIFDPSSYYGHNEADLSIARIFGGFPPSFFAAYHEQIPPSEPVNEYGQRAALYELFHYLNHTALFGVSFPPSIRCYDLQPR